MKYVSTQYPVPSTFLRAIRCNHFTSWAGITGNFISKYLLKVEETVKVHLGQYQKNPVYKDYRDTRNKKDVQPQQEEHNEFTGDIMCSVIDANELISKLYSDKTGCFSVKSSRGNQYMLSCIILI